MPRKKPAAPKAKPSPAAKSNDLYTLDVFLRSGPISEQFAKKNRVVSRVIQIRGDQTLEDLHEAIFAAFDRFDAHMYEFQFGKGPMDPKGPRYVLRMSMQIDDCDPRPAGTVDATTIASLGLTEKSQFEYWFDFGDDWWHQIDVVKIEPAPAKGKFPKVIERVGESPPQYLDEDEQ